MLYKAREPLFDAIEIGESNLSDVKRFIGSQNNLVVEYKEAAFRSVIHITGAQSLEFRFGDYLVRPIDQVEFELLDSTEFHKRYSSVKDEPTPEPVQDVENVKYDDQTLNKVRAILMTYLTSHKSDSIINDCLNKGILFRERGE